MSLPKIMVPRFAVTLPSDGREVTYRPFLVKEEKALLMAVEAKDQDSIIRAIKDTITACVEGVNVEKLPYFDIEYLFLNIRAKSIGEEVKFTYRHREGINLKGEQCAAHTEVIVRIDDVNVQRTENHVSKIMLDDRLGVKMKYPTIDSIRMIASDENGELKLMASCIEHVFDADNVYPPDTLDEAVAFLENLNAKQYALLSKFFETMPKLSHEIKYQCIGCGQEDTVRFEGVSDFF